MLFYISGLHIEIFRINTHIVLITSIVVPETKANTQKIENL